MAKPLSVTEMRRKGKTERLLKIAHQFLLDNRASYEDFIRAHRLLYDISPDPDDVSDVWEEDE